MRFANPFTAKGIWLKGNTHTHTTESDGALTPGEVVDAYGERGYDFLFLTDHWKRTEHAGGKGVLAIGGEEIDFTPVAGGPCHHVVCFGLKEGWERRKFRSLGALARYAAERGVHLIIAHPYWSGVRSQAYMGLSGFVGVEVHNSVCGNIGRSLSAVHWDDMLQSGMRMFGFASDDTHRMNPHLAFGGWIMVKARSKTEGAIFDSIREGLFYSTQGPEIRDISVMGDTIRVSCSPCARIQFISRRSKGKVVFAEGAGGVTEASYAFPPDGVYVRVECVDGGGKTAWSNPVFLS